MVPALASAHTAAAARWVPVRPLADFQARAAAVDYLIPMNTQMSTRQANGDIGSVEAPQGEQKGPRQIWRKGEWIRQTAKMQARGI